MTAIGIVCGPHAAACCAVDREAQTVTSREFAIPALTHYDLAKMISQNYLPMELQLLHEFLETVRSQHELTITLAVPSFYWKDTDAAVFITIAHYLVRAGHVRPNFVHIEEMGTLVFERAFDQVGIALELPDGDWPNAGLLVYESEVLVLSTMLFGNGDQSNDTSHAAITAAFIAANEPLYRYVTSKGTPHSAQDIVSACQAKSIVSAMLEKTCSSFDLTNVNVDMSPVVASTECFSLSFENFRRERDFREIAMDYAIVRKRYSDLGELQSLKFAVLSVCKDWGIALYCASLLDERFLVRVVQGLTMRESELKDRPKLILQLLNDKTDKPVAMSARLKQTLRHLGENGIDISLLAMEVFSDAQIETASSETLAFDAASQAWSWLFNDLRA